MNFINSVRKRLKELLVVDIKGSFEYMDQILDQESNKYNEFVLLKATYFHSEKLFLLNLSRDTDTNIDLNKSRLAILNFIDTINKNDLVHNNTNASSAKDSQLEVFFVGVDIFKNPFDDTLNYLVREKYRINSNHLERLFRIQIREEYPEISVLQYVDHDGNFIFEYLASSNIIFSRKIILMRFNGETSNIINCSPTTVNPNDLKNPIPKIFKIEC